MGGGSYCAQGPAGSKTHLALILLHIIAYYYQYILYYMYYCCNQSAFSMAFRSDLKGLRLAQVIWMATLDHSQKVGLQEGPHSSLKNAARTSTLPLCSSA